MKNFLYIKLKLKRLTKSKLNKLTTSIYKVDYSFNRTNI